VRLVLAGVEAPGWQEHLIDSVIVGTREPRPPALQPLDQPLGGGPVTTAACPIHQPP
jgi:hypothetical protein